MTNNLAPGDLVRLQGQTAIGEVVYLRSEKAVVRYQIGTLTVAITQLEKVTKKNTPSPKYLPPIVPLNQAPDLHTTFEPTLDLHGYTPEEALQALGSFIDKAFLLGHHRLEIIHGKGRGILRRQVHNYLEKHPQVCQIVSEHRYRGLEGVTIALLI